jgi:hypothetical protein
LRSLQRPYSGAKSVPAWSGAGGVGCLVGVFPGRIERYRYGRRRRYCRLDAPFAPLGTPLIDRELGAAVIAAGDHLARDPALPSLLLLPYCPSRAPTQALPSLAGRSLQSMSFARYRALLAAGRRRRRAVSTAPSAPRSARSCGGSAGASPRTASC